MSNITVILNQKVENLGEIGEIVLVKAGFFRNYLGPKNLAVPANSPAAQKILKDLKEKRKEKEHRAAIKKEKKIKQAAKQQAAAKRKAALLEKKVI